MIFKTFIKNMKPYVIVGTILCLLGLGSIVWASMGWQAQDYFTFKNVYASLSDDDSTHTIALTTQGTYYGWMNASSTLSMASGADFATINTTAGTTSTITVGRFGGGIYRLAYSASISINATGENVHCAIFHNGIKYQRASAEAKLGTITDVVTLSSLGGFAQLNSGDVIDLRCANESSGGKTLTLNHASFSILRVSQ
jgi:hypothetical protein